jgi:hypothetical protein
MSSIIRLKETETTDEMFEILQNTIYAGLGKTEILRAILADKTWEIKSQMSMTNQYFNKHTKSKLKKSYQSHKQGKSIIVKNQDVKEFLAAKQIAT